MKHFQKSACDVFSKVFSCKTSYTYYNEKKAEKDLRNYKSFPAFIYLSFFNDCSMYVHLKTFAAKVILRGTKQGLVDSLGSRAVPLSSNLYRIKKYDTI
jgi:hypothetical protein